MTLEQELIAEKVIQLHKANKGIYDWTDFIEVFNTTHDDRLVIARALRDKDFIGDHSTGTRLKEPGWIFKGFESERQKHLSDKNRQEQKDISDNLDFRKKSWEYKYRKLPFFISSLALFGTIFSIIISYKSLNKKQDPKDLLQVKQDLLKLQVRVMVQDSLFRMDTLLKKHR